MLTHSASTLLPLQILFLNMVTDVFPALALGLGSGDKTVMDRPPRDPKSLIISNRNWITISLYAAAMTIAIIVAVIYCRLTISSDSKILNNVAFITLVFAQLFHVFNMSSTHSKLIVNEVTKNKFVWLALFICTLIMVLVYAIPQMRLVLGLTILPPKIWLVSILSAMIPLVLFQFYKIITKTKKVLNISARHNN